MAQFNKSLYDEDDLKYDTTKGAKIMVDNCYHWTYLSRKSKTVEYIKTLINGQAEPHEAYYINFGPGRALYRGISNEMDCESEKYIAKYCKEDPRNGT